MLTENSKKYFNNLKKDVDFVYSEANSAKKIGIDPVSKVEIPLAMNMAQKIIGLISNIYPEIEGVGIEGRIIELEGEFGKLDPTVVFKIAQEISQEKFCKFKDHISAIDCAIRVGFAYITLAVVSSPIEGFVGIKIKKTHEGKNYLEASFAGPIRSAGTTASCLVLMLIDYLRELFGFAKYDPSEEENKRNVSELNDFHERVANLQYMPTDDEILFLSKNMPIQVAGEPSEKLEVSNYKNLERVGTNFLRSGFCLIFAEGLAQKAAKGFRLYNQAKKNGIYMTGFDWLNDYIEFHEKRTKGEAEDSSATYIKDLVAGRPVFGHPSKIGSFRFRYGVSRNNGFSAASVHPATMGITNDFIAIGTQLKIEKPTKGCIITTNDKIEGPIVKLKNGSVEKVETLERAREIYEDIEEIIYLGDIMIPYSDLLNRNRKLIAPGYVEEWWARELEEKINKKIDFYNITYNDAVNYSKEFGVSLYPKLIYYWNSITREELVELINSINGSDIISGKISLKLNESKKVLEKIGLPHKIIDGKIVLDELESKKLIINLGLVKENSKIKVKEIIGENILEIINNLSDFEIRDKSGTFIGARMGRPEKAKLRKLSGSPNVLFPLGKEGGRLKILQTALEKGEVNEMFPISYCEKCKSETIYSTCEKCKSKTKKMGYDRATREKGFFEGDSFCYKKIDIKHYYESAVKDLGVNFPVSVKCIKDSTSAEKDVENLAKGILRAKYNLSVNKDGTIRIDATEMPLTFFKSKEIGTSVKKLRELGYIKDIDGNDLESDDQILRIMPHDVLIPNYSIDDELKGEDIFTNVCNFVDDELELLYKKSRIYNIKTREDLIGKLGVCMAPHNCAGVVCRFIGFSETLGLMASPFMHAAIRRDCDGDEAAIMILGDVLLNFSRKYLPRHRGSTQDAPLVLNAKIDAGEVDDQILDFECVNEYPLELYQKATEEKHSSEVNIDTIKSAMKRGEDVFEKIGFTHNVSDFNYGVKCSNYKILPTMNEKVDAQMDLAEKINAVDEDDVARLIIERHFIRDMKGNLRKFSMQTFRCSDCNEIMRRTPINGKCPRCESRKILFTVNEGGIKKYLDSAMNLSEKYKVGNYLKQSLVLVKEAIESIFG